jgi:hypothetical protein
VYSGKWCQVHDISRLVASCIVCQRQARARMTDPASCPLVCHSMYVQPRVCATGPRISISAEAQDGHQRMENESGDSVRLLADAESATLQHLHQSPLLQNQHQRLLSHRKYAPFPWQLLR